jgi:hypothetical protein
MQSKPGGYKLVEKTNQGPSGSPRGKVGPGHGQDSDNGSEKDNLVPLQPMQHDPYRAKPEDFPVKDVDDATGQSGAHGTAEGQDTLASLSENQCGPRHIEDGGPGSSGAGTPTSWESGGRAARVASNFPVTRNTGEANQQGGEISIAESVNLKTGLIEAAGYKPTRMKETEEKRVSIPAGR